MLNNKPGSDINFLRPRFKAYFTEWRQDWYKAPTKGLKIHVTFLRENQINKLMAQLSFRLLVFPPIWKNDKRMGQIHDIHAHETRTHLQSYFDYAR